MSDWAFGVVWVLTNTLGWSVAWQLPMDSQAMAVRIVAAVIACIPLGIWEWWALARRVPHSIRWSAAYSVGWSVGLVLSVQFGGATGGATIGVLSGPVLIWLLRHSAAANPEPLRNQSWAGRPP